MNAKECSKFAIKGVLLRSDRKTQTVRFMKRTFLFLIWLLYVCTVSAEKVTFHSIRDTHGISNREAFSICKDTNGFIWASTKTALFRITESACHAYALKEATKDFVSVKLEYDSTCLWAYTNNGQLFAYNERIDAFEKKLDVRNALNVRSIHLSDVESFHQESVWIASTYGLFQWNGKDLTRRDRTRYGVDQLAQINDSILLYTAFEGLFLHHIRTNQIEQIHQSTNTNRFQATSLHYDALNQCLWIGTKSNGLLFYHFSDSTLQQSLFSQITAFPILSITMDQDSTRYIGLDGQGLWHLDKTGQTVLAVYREDPDQPNSLLGDGVYDVFCDGNRKWVATFTGGISYFQHESSDYSLIEHRIHETQSLGNNQVNQVLQDRNGTLWFATANGLSQWNPSTQVWKHFYQNYVEHAKVFTALCEDADGNIWAGSFSSGVYVLDAITGQLIRRYDKTNQSDYTGDYILDFFTDSEGDIWIGGNHPLTRFDRRSGTFVSYEKQHVNSICAWTSEQILMTSSSGLHSFNKRTLQQETLIDGILAQDVLYDKGLIWVATGGSGLLQYDPASGKTKHYTIESGLPSNYVNSIVVANEDLWIGTEKGLCRLIPRMDVIQSFATFQDWTTLAFNGNAEQLLSDGSILWGTNTGALLHNPEQTNPLRPEARLFLQDIQIKGSSIRTNPKLVQTNPVNALESLVLNADQNNVRVELLSVGTSTSGVRFAWKLEGFDTGWSRPSSLSIIHYSNIPPGTYTLRMQLLDGLFANVLDERVLSVRIIPPFWQTTWFLIAFALCVIALILYLIHAYSNHLKQLHTKEKIRSFVHLAHDIRTSITLIRAPIEALSHAPELSQTSNYYIQLANSQAEKLSEFANQLLDFQKIDSGMEVVVRTKFDLIPLIQNRISMFDAAATKKKLTWNTAYSTERFCILADELKIEKIIDNLLSNAIKYSFEGGTIDVKVNAEANKWTLEVRDYGMGIKKEDQSKLFTDFYRAENAINSKIIGSGIGLILIKEYVHIHNGTFSFESEEHQGSRFVVCIPNPLHESETFSEMHCKPDPRQDLTAISDGVRPTVLVVEDNEDLLQFLSVALSKAYSVVCARNGEEAWEQVCLHLPDLVISDVLMPRGNGYELCKRIKTTFDTAHIPVLLLTSLSDKESQLAGLEVGADDYICKPFDLAILMQRMHNTIVNRETVRGRTFGLDREAKNQGRITDNELNDDFIKKALEIATENIGNAAFGKDDFAAALHVSSSLLYKKLKSLTDQSPSDFLKTLRMNHALSLLKQGKHNITEVSELSGYSSLSIFSRAFKNHFGKSPTEI